MQKYLNYGLYTLLALCILSGCATTTVDAITKPGVDLTRCDNFLVKSNIEDAVFRTDLETKFVDKFSSSGKKALEGTNAKPDSNYDYLMEVKLLSSSIKLDHKEIGRDIPVSFALGIGTSPEVTEKVSMSFDIIVTDMRDNEIIFRGTATSDTEESTAEDCVDAIFRSVAGKAVKYFCK